MSASTTPARLSNASISPTRANPHRRIPKTQNENWWDHTTLCRRAETLEVPRPKPRGDGAGGGAGRDTGPMHLLVDSTGLKLYGAGEWLVEKHGTKRRRSWRASMQIAGSPSAVSA